MGIFSKVFGSSRDNDNPLSNLERQLKNADKVTLDYGIYAREIVAKKMREGSFKNIESEVMSELISNYEERLEDIVNWKVLGEVERLGKLNEFEQVINAGLDRDAYLTHTIPNYRIFLTDAIAEAKQKI